MGTWTFIAGLGLFLYGLSLMEQVSKQIAGRPFKLLLRRYSKSLPKAIIGGTFITSLIQSSSVVILMLMSFVSAGVISFRNAFGLLIGSNLGTTVDSWFVATVGFTFNLQSYSLPVIGVTAIAMFFSKKRKQLYNSLYFIFSIGILFLGFGFMREGAGQLMIKFDIAAYADLNLFLILLIGFLVTVVIQSSSATVAIALTALHTHALTFPAAAAVIIGSEVGTTIKILFSSINSQPAAKMLAWADFIFNLFTAVVSFVLLTPIIYFIQHIIRIHDPQIGLVFFQSFINLLSIILFLPLIGPFSNSLERFMSKKKYNENKFNKDIPPIPELLPGVMQQAAALILDKVLEFHKKIFETDTPNNKSSFLPAFHSFTRIHGTTNSAYIRIKEAEGEYLAYYGAINEEDLSKEAYSDANRYIDSIRQSIHAAKAVHDIRHNLKTFHSSADNYLFQKDEQISREWASFKNEYMKLFELVNTEDIKNAAIQLEGATLGQYEVHEQETKMALYKQEIQQIDASTLLNVYQEILSSQKALLRAFTFLKLNTP